MVFLGPSRETPEAHYDGQREREFYRYYDPVRALSASGPRWTNLYDEAATREHQPSSCPDLSLTAFCQLGALRLAARRCMLFFFDRTNAYVMAEATRTLSLQDHDVHESGDGLWLGFTIIPRGLSVCEHTVNMPPGGDNTPIEEVGEANLLHIIDDMQGSARFCDRPYVKDGPKARFYAGVPIITPGGLRIGAYCVLDDKPRDGLSEADVKFMLEMGKTVMAHLETVRERAEFGRGTRMLKGLRSFVQDASSRRSEDPITNSSTVRFSQDEDRYSSDNRNVSGSDGGSRQITLTKPTPEVPSQPFNQTTTPPASPKPVTATEPSYDAGTLSIQAGSDASSVFQNAATLVRDAMDAEGCIFLDVDSGQQGSIAKYYHRRTLSDNSAAATDTGSENGEVPRRKSLIGGCPVLGQSHRSSASRDGGAAGAVPASTLQRLLRKYPRGKIWNFNSDGEVLSSDQLTDTHVKQPGSLGITELSRKRRKQRYSTADDAEELRHTFPEVRSLCLVGLWDLKSQKWRAGAIVWSRSPVRVFSVKGELGFVVAFGEVIMAEVTSLEAKREEKKRSDFVSSISHELRSPLHGILGSLDMLNQEHPSLQNSTDTKQIESCTLTMLDLVEHLLSYAEYQRKSKKRQTIDGMNSPDSDESQPERPQSMDLSPGISIAKATEEIAGVLMHSHQCDTSTTGGGNTDMALDIALGPEYILKAGVGDWKRLCSIVIGNALKFTDKGHVSVSLRLSKKRKRSLAVLSVTDTGCGMSRDFMQDGLFRAFQQEDGLRVGMGLGMTLASKIVRGLGGKIQVSSEQNQGSVFRVTVPVEVNAANSETPAAAFTLHDVKINIKDFVADGVSIRPEVVEVLRQTYERLNPQFVSAAEAQVIVLFDDELDELRKQQYTNPPLLTKPLLILCRDTAAIHKFREAKRALPNPFVEYIPQPYGPKRLTEAIRYCASYEHKPLKSRSNSTTYSIQRQSSQIEIDTLSPAFASMHIPATEPVTIEPHLPRSTEPGAQQQPDKAPQIASIKQESIRITATSIERPDTISTPKDTAAVAIPSTLQNELSLLLVDDNPVNLRLLTTFASKKSHPFLTATNGQEAVDAFSKAVMHPCASTPKPDVILLDINMPIMDGFEAARCIRNLECLYNVPATKIIALTGLGSEQARREAMQNGIDMFLTKPVRLKELSGILATVKKRSR